MARPALPPFTLETAIQKVRMAEDGWNVRPLTGGPVELSPELAGLSALGL